MENKKNYFQSQQILRSSKEEEDFYKLMNEKGIKYHELFIILASLGFKYNRKVKRDRKGIETRINFFTEESKLIASTILLKDTNSNIDIPSLFDSDNFKVFNEILESYASGGIQYIVEKYLSPDVLIKTENYKNQKLEQEIFKIVYSELNQAPF